MCEYCKPNGLSITGFSEKDITKQISKVPIAMGDYLDVLQLETWMMSNEKGKDTKLYFGLSMSNTSDEIASSSLQIKYCPFCGREL